MLNLCFDPLSITRAATCTRALRVIVAGPQMRTDPDNALMAVYQNHFWQIGGAFSTSAEIHGRCTVHFEEEGVRSRAYGPADGCKFADGCLRLGLQGTEILVRYDEADGRWFVMPEQQHYPAILIESA